MLSRHRRAALLQCQGNAAAQPVHGRLSDRSGFLKWDKSSTRAAMICQTERRAHGASARPSALFVTSFLSAVLLAAGAYARPQQGGTAAATPARVIELRIGDEIEPIMAEYVDGGIEQAAREHAS